jgi:hypothetical protein
MATVVKGLVGKLKVDMVILGIPAMLNEVSLVLPDESFGVDDVSVESECGLCEFRPLV